MGSNADNQPGQYGGTVHPRPQGFGRQPGPNTGEWGSNLPALPQSTGHAGESRRTNWPAAEQPADVKPAKGKRAGR